MAAFLAALLAEREPRGPVLIEKVAHTHAHDRSDAYQIVEHDREQRPIATHDQVGAVERREEAAHLFALEHGGLALRARDADATDGGRGIAAEHTDVREPLEPLPDAAQMLVDARGAAPLGELVEVRGDEW